MLEKSRNAVFFQWFVCQVSRKVGLLKRRVRSHVVREESKNCTPLWRKAHSEVKMYKTWRVRSTFVSSDVEKMHAAVAKSTFGSENVTKHVRVREHFLYVLMSKNCTPLWRKAHLEVKMYKTWRVRSTFCTFWCRKIARRCGEKQIWKWKCTKHVGFGKIFEVLMSKN